MQGTRGVPEGASGHPTPLGCVYGGTSWPVVGLMRGVGNSWVVPAVPTVRSNCRKLHMTGSWGAPAIRSANRAWCLLGAATATGHGVCWVQHQQQDMASVGSSISSLCGSLHSKGCAVCQLLGCCLLCSSAGLGCSPDGHPS